MGFWNQIRAVMAGIIAQKRSNFKGHSEILYLSTVIFEYCFSQCRKHIKLGFLRSKVLESQSTHMSVPHGGLKIVRYLPGLLYLLYLLCFAFVFAGPPKIDNCAVPSLAFGSHDCGHWFLNSRFMKDFKKAQRLLKLPDNREDNLEAIFAWYSFRKGAQGSQCWRYVPCAKCGSETLHASLNLRDTRRVGATDHQSHCKSVCTFAFIREPLSHFISGYREFEYRLRGGIRKFGTNDFQSMTFHKLPEGSLDRIRAFIQDIVALRFYVAQNNPPIPRAMAHRGAFSHVCPVSGSLVGYSYDFVGNLSSLATDFEIVKTKCKVARSAMLQRVEHPSSNMTRYDHVGDIFKEPHFQNAMNAILRPDIEFYNKASNTQWTNNQKLYFTYNHVDTYSSDIALTGTYNNKEESHNM